MKRYIQHGFLKISHFISKEWPHPVHNHNHFEIIFIHRGKGLHCLSGMHHSYNNKCLFLLAPCDFHHFKIEEETEFTFLKFTNIYLKGVGNVKLEQQWNQEIDQLLIQARHESLPLLKTEKDSEKLEDLIKLIVGEWKETKQESNEVIYFLMQALLSLVKRNINHLPPGTRQKHKEKIISIINYLHLHIYTAENTQLEHLAEIFGYSKYYFGIFFKEQTGITLRNYVNQYKLHLIESRLKYSSLSIKEISSELGFTDLSHFNKFFKKNNGDSPSSFRNKETGKSRS